MIGETLNFGNVSGAASSATAVFTATGIIMDINQSLGSAGTELMQEYVNATGGPGGYVVQMAGENMGSYAWDPTATPDSPGFIAPGQWVWISSGEQLYYTSQTDIQVNVRTLREIEIVSTPTMSTEAKVMLALDILENFVPGLNLVIAAGKAAYYLSQGNIAEVGWAVAGLVGGDIIRAACTVMVASAKVVQYSYKAAKALAAPTKAVKKVDEVVAVVDEVAEVATKKADEIYTYDIGGGITCTQKRPKSITSLDDAANEGVTIVGEGMARVEAAASKIPNAKILDDMPIFTGTPEQITSQMMAYNRKWILEQMRTGRSIMDIGLDMYRTKPPSIFYQMELNMMKNYLKLHPNFFQIIVP